MKNPRGIYLTLAVSLLFSAQAFATPGIQKAFINKYPDVATSQLNACTTCHMPLKEGFLNAYAIALKTAKLDFDVVKDVDSDEDGKTNIEEITALTFPGSQAAEAEKFVFTNKVGTITFDHAAHSLSAAYTINGACTTCHTPEEPKHFPKYFNDNVLVKDQGHATCLGCHKEKVAEHPAAPTKCTGCHKKDMP